MAIAAAGAAVGLTVLAYRSPRDLPASFAATPEVANLGEVAQGVVRARFQLVNHTDRDIRVAHVEKACQCTGVTFSRSLLRPGEQATADCEWDTKGMRGPSSTALAVYYASGGGPGLEVLHLGVEAVVVPAFDYSPTRLEFEPGRPAAAAVRLAGRGEAKVEVLGAHCSHEAFRAAIPTPQAVAVTFRPDLWPGDPLLRPKLTIMTSCPTEKVVEVPLRVKRP